MSKKPDPEHIDDSNPEWTDADFKKAKRPDSELVELSKRPVGRPVSENPKQRTTLYLDSEIMEYFKSTGKGWQTRINKILREYKDSHQ